MSTMSPPARCAAWRAASSSRSSLSRCARPGSSGPRRSSAGPTTSSAVLDDIGNSIVASISAEIETVERNRAMLKAPNSLNAWEAYHRGLWHMYRFTRGENEQARHFFEHRRCSSTRPSPAPMPACPSPIGKMPSSAGATATGTARCAFETAGQSLLVDDHNPAAHWAMGRALWLRGDRTTIPARAGTSRRPQPQFRARPLRAVLRAVAVGRPASGDRIVGSFAPSVARSTRCCSACWAHGPWRMSGSASSTRRPNGR